MSSDRAQVHVYPEIRHEGGPQNRYYHEGGTKIFDENGPSASQILALVIGLPVGGTLLALSGLSLIGTLIGLAVATPLFILFSPILVPAAITIALAVAGILLSGACGLTALASFSWLLNYTRQTHGSLLEQLDRAKYRAADAAEYMGQKTKESGQDIKNKALETKRT